MYVELSLKASVLAGYLFTSFYSFVMFLSVCRLYEYEMIWGCFSITAGFESDIIILYQPCAHRY